jgi:hypothetical protein
MSCSGCREAVSHSIVKVEELRRALYVDNPGREPYFKTRVDRCLVRERVAADYVISKSGVGDVIVELKGTDVAHGVRQVSATAEYISGCERPRGPLAGVVVCRQYPRFDSNIRREVTAFVRRFRRPVHIFTKNETVSFQRLLEFPAL